MQNLKPYDNPLWEENNQGGEKERREETPLIVDTLLCLQRTRAAQFNSLGPKARKT
jgi:hypothetical protein